MSPNAKTLLALALAAALLAGCGRSTTELRQELDAKRQRPGGRIEPIPEITPYESFAYDPTQLRSPFLPPAPAAPGAGGLRPDVHRNREFLEGFSLDTLKMVGTLKQGGHNYGLVQTKDGLVHKVLPGNYVGQNDGRVTAVTESKISVVEIVPDGMGGYMERPAAISLGTN
jgi:type IV pilus assembly protein PilP